MRTALCVLTVLVFSSSVLAKAPVREKKVGEAGIPVIEGRSLDCSSAIPINVGDFVVGDNTGAPRNVLHYSCTNWSESGGEVVFQLTVEGAGCRILGISLGYDEGACDLDLFILDSCDENSCIFYDDYEDFFDCFDPGTYYIVVDGYDGDECPFTLTIVETTPPEDCCPLVSVCQEFDFNVSDGGFSTLNCNGSSVWEWGESDKDPDVDCSDEAVTNVLGTVLDGNTYDYSGEVAVIGPVAITAECTCMELCHYYLMEGFYDGGNVKVSTDGGSSWDLLIPASFYDEQDEFLSLDTRCTRGELAYSDEYQATEYKSDCFDLSEYVGESVLVGFFFGSDVSWGTVGWYINSVRFGLSQTPVQESSWGAIKALYR